MFSSYRDAHELWMNVLGHLSNTIGLTEVESRVGKTRRVHGFVGRITSPKACIIHNSVRKFKIRYGIGEFTWYLNGTGSLDHIKHYCPGYGNFADDNYGSYGPRLLCADSGNQLIAVMNELMRSPNSRRSVAVLWQSRDLSNMDAKDVPCNLTWKFYLDEGKLNMIADMRSNDAWLGMPNDIFVNCQIQIMMARLLDVDLGWYQHQVGDLHLYENNWDKAKAALSADESYPTTMPWRDERSVQLTWEDIQKFLQWEKDLRVDESQGEYHSDKWLSYMQGRLYDNR